MTATATRSKSSTAKKAPAKKASAKPTNKKGTSIAKKNSVKKAPKKSEAKKTEIKLKAKDPNKKKKGFHMLSAFSILFIIIAILVVVSWVLQWSGVHAKWDTINKDNSMTHHDEAIKAMGLVDIFYSVFLGFEGKVGIIAFILVLGAFITIVVNSKALEGFADSITSRLKGKEVYAIIPLMIFFSICGTAEGMAEESLGFYMICIPLVMAAGFDVFTGLLVVLLGAGIGVLASTVNPFVVSVAVDGMNGGLNIASTDPNAMTVGDGLVWRLVIWVVLTACAIGFVMWYAMRVKKNPQKSITFSTYEGDKAYFLGNKAEKIVMDWRKKLTLAIFGLTFVIMIVYLVGWDAILDTDAMAKAGQAVNDNAPYVTRLVPGFGEGGLEVPGMFFLISSIIVGLVNGLGEDKFLSQFMAGAGDILSVCLIIATAGGIGAILENSYMQQLFVNGLSKGLGGMNPIGEIIVLYFIFLILSFIIPSSSGFAAAIFPIIGGSVATGVGAAAVFNPVSASGSVLAFSMANGLLNLFTPTSGVVMGAIAIARMDYGKFLKGMAPIIAGTAILSIALLAIGGVIADPSLGNAGMIA